MIVNSSSKNVQKIDIKWKALHYIVDFHLSLVLHWDGGGGLGDSLGGGLLRGGDHQDAVGAQVGVDAVNIATVRQSVAAAELPQLKLAVRLFLMLGLHRQQGVLDIDPDVVGAEVVHVQAHLKLGVVILDADNLLKRTYL